MASMPIATPLYSFYFILIQLPYYLKVPFQLFIDAVLFYVYVLFYPKEKEIYERKKTLLAEVELTYGELSYASLEKAMSYSKITPRSIFVDLGCGKGKLVFYVHQRYQMKAVGVDVIPSYIRFSKALLKKHQLSGIKFVEKDFFKSKFSRASHVLVCTTCFSKTRLIQVKKKLETLVKGCVIISISNPIKGQGFKSIASFEGTCSWGKTTVYIQKRC